MINRQKEDAAYTGVNGAKGTNTDGETPRDKQQSRFCPRDTEHHGVRCVMPVHVGVREGCGLLLSCLSWPNPPRSQLAAKPG